ncbi:MAG: hypothetical protein ACOC9S_06770, partial [Planctomycetota bacterium]
VLGCGLTCRIPQESAPTPMEMGREGPLLRHRLAFEARQPGSLNAGPSPPPDFGPNLDDNTGSGTSSG